MSKNIEALEDVLKEYSQQKNNTVLSYSKLVYAIEFFSQRFSLENIKRYIFEFTIDLLQVDSCVIFTNENGIYEISDMKGDFRQDIQFPKEMKHDQLVYFHAGLMEDVFMKSFLEPVVINEFKPEYGIPLIMDKSLYGMILIQKNADEITKDDRIIAEALMNLFSLSLTNFESYERLESTKKELDSKVFNLFAINQASKALLSELDTQYLINLSLSVFSELTQSQVTSIFMYDEIGKSFKSMGMIDVYNKVKERPLRLNATEHKNNSLRVVIDYKDSKCREVFQEFFSDQLSILEYYSPAYIVNLILDGVLLGFVTISEKVNKEEYNKGVFELIESLASSTYVAISNAKHMEEITRQQKLIEDKFIRLQVLNKLVKNMNTANEITGLLELTLETLRVSYGYKTSFFALFDEEISVFKILHHVNFTLDEDTFKCTDYVEELKEGKMIIRYHSDDVAEVLAEIYSDELYEKVQGMVMIPILIEDTLTELVGVICLLDVEVGIISTEENILTLETIGNHIAPIVKQLKLVDTIKKNYNIDYKKHFKEQLIVSMTEADETDTQIYIVIIKSNVKHLFDESFNEKLMSQYHYCYCLDSNHVAVICHSIDALNSMVDKVSDEYESKIIEYPAKGLELNGVLEQIQEYVYSS